MACPWANITQKEPISLTEIIREEINKSLEIKREKTYRKKTEIINETLADLVDITEDALKTNKEVKNFRIIANVLLNDECSDESMKETDFSDNDSWDNLESLNEFIFENRYKKSKKGVSDLLMPLNFEFKESGTEMFDKVFNELKLFSHFKQTKKYSANTKNDKALAEFCIHLLMNKIVSVNCIINIGKNSLIFHADSNTSCARSLPREFAVKIYKTTLSKFKQRSKYLQEDRYLKEKICKDAARQPIQIKAEKEKKMLLKLHKAKVKCPQVVTLKTGILVTTFIGKNKKAAPTLHNAVMSQEDYKTAFFQVMDSLKKMYNANIIHGRLSENNILWFNQCCYFIDVGHCIERTDEDAFPSLFRDCTNIVKFFSRRNSDIFWFSPWYFIDITGCSFNDKKSLQQLRDFFKKKTRLRANMKT